LSAIFISYRREDAEDSARALYESLIREFGKDRLFMDVEAIALGADFRQAVERSLDECGVFLAVIGTTWVDIKAGDDPNGERRLDNPGDYVRQEVATALKRGAGLPVIPVLVRGANMPAPAKLPDDLKDLAYRNALTLSHVDWDGNLAKLVAAIRPHVDDGTRAPQPSPEIAAVLKHGMQAQKFPTSRTGAQDAADVGSEIEFTSAAKVKVGKGVLIGIPLLIVAAVVAYFVLKPQPKPKLNPGQAGMAITIVRNSHLTGVPGPVDFVVDGEQQGQIQFDDRGNTPIQLHIAEGEHQFTISNPQTKARCAGTFQVSTEAPKLVLRMRDSGTVCTLQPLTKGDAGTQ